VDHKNKLHQVFKSLTNKVATQQLLFSLTDVHWFRWYRLTSNDVTTCFHFLRLPLSLALYSLIFKFSADAYTGMLATQATNLCEKGLQTSSPPAADIGYITYH